MQLQASKQQMAQVMQERMQQLLLEGNWAQAPKRKAAERDRGDSLVAAAPGGTGVDVQELVRDHADTKTLITPFQPLSSAHYALHKRVKAAFDPLSVLNLGRMHDGI